MTDFLTSIANRNFAVSATIRPRLVSLFEPAEGPSIERERPLDSQQHDRWSHSYDGGSEARRDAAEDCLRFKGSSPVLK